MLITLMIFDSNTFNSTNPEKILQDVMAMDSFYEVPILILDASALPSLPFVKRHIKHKLKNHIYKDKLSETLKMSLPLIKKRIAGDRKQKRMIGSFYAASGIDSAIPAHEKNPEEYKALDAGLIFLSSKNYTLDNFVNVCFGISREGLAPLEYNNSTARLNVLFHELAHIAGAGEPQADKISAIFMRRYIPQSKTYIIRSDARAMDAVMNATALAANICISPEENTDILKQYGWSMVEAGDSVACMSQEAISAMTQDDIMSHRFEKYDQSLDKILALGEIAKKCNLHQTLYGCRMNGVVIGAEILAKTIVTYTTEPQLRAMAQRFAIAARRLYIGQAAYKDTELIPKKPTLRPALV